MRAALQALSHRSLENPQQPLTSEALSSLLVGPSTDSGVTVSPRRSMAMSAVYRCVSLIAGVSSALPLPVYAKNTRDRRDHPLLDDPHPDLTHLELWRLAYVHRLLWGNAYLQKIRSRAGEVQWLYPIAPERVEPVWVKPSASNPGGKLWDVKADDGQQHLMGRDDILHLPGLGFDGLKGASVIRLAAQGIGLGLAAEEYGSRLFGSGTLLSGVLTTDRDLKEEKAEALTRRWKAKMAGLRRAHEVAILDSGTTFQSLTMPNTDAQFLESRRFQTSEVARFFGVPPFLLGETEKSTSWGTGLEQQALGWVVFDLHPQWLAPTEQRITKELLPPTLYANYKVQGLLRGDSAARAAYYRVMREVGAFCADDIRELEDMPPLPDGEGQTFLQPANMQALGADPVVPVPDQEETTE